MSVWHGDSHKKKLSGGAKRAVRKKRRFEKGSFPAETTLGDVKRKIERRKGGKMKIKTLRERYACVTDPNTGKTEKIEIRRVIRNRANIDYDRRGVMTRGAVIETPQGLARITSRPGQDGTINAVLIGDKDTE